VIFARDLIICRSLVGVRVGVGPWPSSGSRASFLDILAFYRKICSMNVCFVCARGPEQQIPDVEVLSNKENLVL
jgi:hypothetical protein